MKQPKLKSYYFKLLCLTVGWAIFLAGGANAQNLQFRYFRMEDGISSDGNYSHHCLLKDQKGFIWIATRNGLNRFDGKSFKVFEGYEGNPNGLDSKGFTALGEDADGNIWVGTPENGIYVYHPNTEKFNHFLADKETPGSLTGNGINFIKKDESNNLWIGTRANGLSRFNWESKSFEYISRMPGDSRETPALYGAMDIHFARDGSIWLGTSKGLHKYIPNKDAFSSPFSPYPSDLPYTFDGVYDITEDANGELWLVNGFRGHKIFNPITSEFRDFPEENLFRDLSNLRTVNADHNGNIWLGAIGGLYFFDVKNNSVKYFKHEPDNLQTAPFDTNCNLFDPPNGSWFMTDNEGLLY